MTLERHTSALISAGAPPLGGLEELDEANQEIGWSTRCYQLNSGGCPAHFLMAEHQGMLLSGESFGGRVHLSAEAPGDAFSFVFPVTGGHTHRAQRRSFGETELLVFPPGSRMDIITSDAVGDLALSLADDAYREAADALFPGSNLLSPPDARILPAQAERLGVIRDRITAALSGWRTDPESLSELLARCVALIADSGGVHSEERFVANDGKWTVVERAVDFIEAHLSQQMRLEELCRHAGVGVRVLQRTLREQLGLTPTQYIKARRLNAARRLLVAGDPHEETVSGIALKCGYTHFGRFSVDYRLHFGEPPHRTLRG